MSNLVITDNVRFPAGTAVGAWPSHAVHHGQVFGDYVELAVVQADGTLTFANLVDGVKYQLAGTVAGALRHMKVVKSSVFAGPPTWKARVAARRAALGTS